MLKDAPAFLLDWRDTTDGAPVRTVVLGQSLKRRLLLIGFQLPADDEGAWVPVVNHILDNVFMHNRGR